MIAEIILLFFVFMFQRANAQYVIGDYKTRQSGDYGDYRTWEVWDGRQFDTATSAPSGLQNIYIDGAYVSNCGGGIHAPFELHVIDYGTMEMSNDYHVYGSMEINSFAAVTKRAQCKTNAYTLHRFTCDFIYEQWRNA